MDRSATCCGTHQQHKLLLIECCINIRPDGAWREFVDVMLIAEYADVTEQ